MRKFKLVVTTGYNNAEHEETVEYSDEQLKDMSENEIQQMAYNDALIYLHEKCECYAEEITKNEDN